MHTSVCGIVLFMMTSSNGNNFRVTGPLWGEFPSQTLVTRFFGVYFDFCLNKRLCKQSRRRWFETLSRSLWRHCNGGYVVSFFRNHVIIHQYPSGLLHWYLGSVGGVIGQSHKSHNAPVPYLTMQHSEQKCAHFCSECCCGIWDMRIVEFVNLAYWYISKSLWNHCSYLFLGRMKYFWRGMITGKLHHSK